MPFAFLLVFALVCHGWGRLLSRLCFGRHPGATIAFDIALGLAVLGAMGGLLNLMHLAKPVFLYTLAAVGIGLSFASIGKDLTRFSWTTLRSTPLRAPSASNLLAYAPHCFVCCCAAFFCFTLVPSAAFNYADDMHTYLVRPVRMLATGSLGGNRFDMLGLDSLGAQSFFQAFLLLSNPLIWINGFDAVFCFALSGFLIIDIAHRLKISWAFSLLAVIAFVSLNPQVVNVSTVYSGAAMILGAFLAAWKLVDALESSELKIAWKFAVPLALLLATLLTLKNTFVFLLIVQLPLFLALLWRATPSRRAFVFSAGTLAAAMISVLLPWVLVTLASYGFPGNWPGHHFAATPLMSKYRTLAAKDISGLFEFHDLFYGGNQFTYNALILCIALSGIAAFFCRGAENAGSSRAYAIPFTSMAIGAFAAYFLNAHMNQAQIAVRYSCPLLLALFPVAGLVLARMLTIQPTTQTDIVRHRYSLLRVLPVVLPLAAGILFFPLSVNRFEQAFYARCLLAFPIDQNLLRYSQYAMGPAGEQVRAIQNRTGRGQTIFAWTAQPFQLDFQRNQVLTACNPGLINPLLRFPAGVPEVEFRQYLRALGVRYVLHQVEGAGVVDNAQLGMWLKGDALHRSIAEYNIYLRGTLLKTSETSRVLYRDDQFVLFELEPSHAQIVTQR